MGSSPERPASAGTPVSFAIAGGGLSHAAPVEVAPVAHRPAPHHKEQRMAPEQQLERSMLDGKDREELHAIAGAMGVKGITRLRKADLVDAILAAAAGQGGGGNGAKAPAKANGATKKRAVRSKKASQVTGDGDIAALAAEEAELAKAGTDAAPEIAPR